MEQVLETQASLALNVKEVFDIPGFIDPHVHCRDEEQSKRATIKEVTNLARSQNVVAFFDMPNTERPVISRERVDERINLAEKEGCLEGYYLWIGVTPEEDQIIEAINVVKNNPRVIGMKMYAGRSVGSLKVLEEEQQRLVYRTLAERNYKGVIAVHCEKEISVDEDKFDPARPYTWNDARPPEAERESVKDQITFAKDEKFEGTLHIAHISTPRGVELVDESRKDPTKKFRIQCAVTPHHLTYSTADMYGKDGLMLKVNPPLRDSVDVVILKRQLSLGLIDMIETDHAPHEYEKKMGPPYFSGIPSLREYGKFVQMLYEVLGAEMVANLTYRNIKAAFPKVIE